MQHITHPAAVSEQGLALSTRTVLSEPRLLLYPRLNLKDIIGYNVRFNHYFSSRYKLKLLGTIVVNRSVSTAQT
jgi:hypothetical protein